MNKVEEFIKDMENSINELCTSDLQATVEAFCMVNGLDSDEMLEEIYSRTN